MLRRFCLRSQETAASKDWYCVRKNHEFCINNEELVLRTRNCVSKTRNFVLNLINFAQLHGCQTNHPSHQYLLEIRKWLDAHPKEVVVFWLRCVSYYY